MSSKRAAAGAPDAKTFTYPRLSGPAAADGAAQPAPETRFVMDAEADAEREQQLLKKGVDEGRAAARAEYERNLAGARAEIGRAVADFAAERRSYFHRVEREVVQLALSIARKILRREAQIDPLLLTGVLRVALEKIGDGSTIRMRVNPAEIERWREYFGANAEKSPVPELVGDAQLEPFRCVLETDVGTTELGLEMQLKEIEQGFLDLLAQRPGAN